MNATRHLPPVLELIDISTRFGQQQIHSHLNLQIDSGQIVGLLGGSGSGKTTLLREMLGLLPPTSGVIRLFGEDLNNPDPAVQRALKRRLGMLFQHGALFSALSVYDNIAFPLRELKCLDEDWIRRLVMLKLSLLVIVVVAVSFLAIGSSVVVTLAMFLKSVPLLISAWVTL